MEIVHTPVMKAEVIEALRPALEGGRRLMLDATTGEGGHSEALLSLFDEVVVFGLDRDEDIQKKAIERLSPYGERFKAVNAWFDDYLQDAKEGSFDAILFDLGISSFHFEEAERGFSFRRDEALDMRLDKSQRLSAKDVINTYGEEELANLIYRYGEERYSRRIARAIRERREQKEIEGSAELSKIILEAVPWEYRRGRIHPATRTFQALRIEVNDELGRLERALDAAFTSLRKKGRMAVISFHSLEDRIVKRHFRSLSDEGRAFLLTKKPLRPTDGECEENPPSRSAKLRVIERL